MAGICPDCVPKIGRRRSITGGKVSIGPARGKAIQKEPLFWIFRVRPQDCRFTSDNYLQFVVCRREKIIRTPCLSKSSRTFAPKRGSEYPNPGAYMAPFWKSGESGYVWGPDWGWCESRKGGVGGVVPGGFWRERQRPGAGIFQNCRPGKFPEKFLKSF
jgi:hypothetical protein